VFFTAFVYYIVELKRISENWLNKRYLHRQNNITVLKVLCRPYEYFMSSSFPCSCGFKNYVV